MLKKGSIVDNKLYKYWCLKRVGWECIYNSFNVNKKYCIKDFRI